MRRAAAFVLIGFGIALAALGAPVASVADVPVAAAPAAAARSFVDAPALQASVVATSNDGLALHALEGALLISAGLRLAVVRDTHLEEARAMSAGLRAIARRCDVALSGTFPAGVRAAVRQRAGARERGVEYRWSGRGWKQARRADPYFDLTPIGDRYSLVSPNRICNDLREECGSHRLLTSHPADCPRDTSFRLLGEDGSVIASEQGRSVSMSSALPDGTVLLASSAGTKLIRGGTLRELPLPDLPNDYNLWLHGLVLVSEREAYLAGEIGPSYDQTPPYLAAFDGSAWTRIPVPFTEGIHALARSPAGTLWLAVGRSKHGELWARDRDGQFVRHPTPGHTPVAIAARSDDDLVIVAREAGCGFPDRCKAAVLMTRGDGRAALRFTSRCR